MTQDRQEKILIVRLSALGDVVHALPMLDALRRARPDAHIGWMVETAAGSLLEDHPQLDRLWVVPRRELGALAKAGRVGAFFALLRQTLRPIRETGYDVLIDAQCNLRSALLSRATGVKRRIGFAPPYTKEGAHWLSTERVALQGEPQPKAFRDLELLRALGIEAGPARAQLGIPEEDRAEARALRSRLGAASLVALHPGVSGAGAIKRWAPERFAGLARRLREDRGATCLVTWGPGEEALAQRIVDASGDGAVLAPPTRSLRALGALYEVCDALVAGDTGPLHLGAALGVPVVGLYGPKDPAIYAPIDGRTGERGRVVWKQVHCSPCKLRRCNEVICMPAITVEDVQRAVDATLSNPAPAFAQGGAHA